MEGGYKQTTLKRAITCTGVGLHTGKRVNMTLHPAEADTGIVFKRVDIPGAPLIPAALSHVVDDTLCTTLGLEGVEVRTVEHLLSAAAGLGVDNMVVELDAPEVPILDGSSAPFLFLMRNAGIRELDSPRRYYRIRRTVEVREGEKFLRASPCEQLEMDFRISYPHPLLRDQRYSLVVYDGNYEREICRARTFGFLKDLQKMYEMGLAKGGSLDNAVVLDDYQVVNEGGLRYPDECVRHKILDFMGDMALVGRMVVGRFIGYKTGHSLNHAFFKRLLSDPQAWELVVASAQEPPLRSAALG